MPLHRYFHNCLSWPNSIIVSKSCRDWNCCIPYKSSHRRCSLKKKVFLKILQNSQENTYVRVSFLTKLQAWGLRATNFIKKETLAQFFSCEFCKIFENLFYRTPLEDCFWPYLWLKLKCSLVLTKSLFRMIGRVISCLPLKLLFWDGEK